MTGPLKGAKPSSMLCRKAGCKELYNLKILVGNSAKNGYYCGITNKVPGNMYQCPKDKEVSE